MLAVKYGWKFSPVRKENAKKAGGERELICSSEATAAAAFAKWHHEAPSWEYWVISSRPATKAEVKKSERLRRRLSSERFWMSRV